ncbi:MAG: KpsF/GutQ family sugar-phosphate isomerase [Granulosicoccus sp.]|nr:KpsF/GutQ family sugar-phosphate isomerase [Granulosicoccus sp.]
MGLSVIQIEAAAIRALEPRINDDFVHACQLLLACRGRVVVCGIGKSGHIGAKLAATLASTGSPAFFVHAAEASHGDLGMFKSDDLVLAISYSGNSSELMALIPGIKRLGIPLISLCGEPDSALARASDVCLSTHIEREACPLGLAPTASTTAALAMGDALAIALLGSRGFTEEDFALSHPGGRLGRRLLLHVTDIMYQAPDCPTCSAKTTLAQALVEMTSGGLGMIAIVDDQMRMVGIFTDGDLRRAMSRDIDIRTVCMHSVMSANPHTIQSTALAVDAVTTMQQLKISALPVVDDESLKGIVTMHALLAAGVV